MLRHFREHPASVGESYFEHMGCALYFGGRMLMAALACLLHAFLPFLFQSTGKRTISDLHHRMVTHRHKCHRKDMPVTLDPAE